MGGRAHQVSNRLTQSESVTQRDFMHWARLGLSRAQRRNVTRVIKSRCVERWQYITDAGHGDFVAGKHLECCAVTRATGQN